MRVRGRSRDGDRMTKSIELIQSIYAAFGRGDVPAILEKVRDDVVWEYQPISTDVPWLQRREGKAGVGAFFAALGGELEFQRFEVKTLVEAPRLVIALVDLDAKVRRTGKEVHEVDEVHLWHLDERGRVARFRHAVDTHAHWLAWQS